MEILEPSAAPKLRNSVHQRFWEENSVSDVEFSETPKEKDYLHLKFPRKEKVDFFSPN